MEEKVSLFKNLEYIESSLGQETIVFLFLMVLVPFILFFTDGRKSKKTGNQSFILTTTTYSIIMGILAYITHVKLIGTGSMGFLDGILDGNVNMGFSVLFAIIGSLIISTLSTFAGNFLAKEGQGQVPSN